jgi:hypothetical protein
VKSVRCTGAPAPFSTSQFGSYLEISPDRHTRPLEVYDSNGVLFASDDNWRENQEQLLLQTGLAPRDDRESAMFLQLQPGAYTAIVRGKNNSTGVGLVEVYNLDAN